MSKTMWCAGSILLAVSLALTACATNSAAIDQSTTTRTAPDIFSRAGGVNVGVVTDAPGFEELEPGANIREGFDVDLYRWLGNQVPPTFTPIPVDLTIDERVNALRDGRVQLVVATFSITDERRESIGFAGPYMLTHQGVMVRTGDTRIQSANDLTGMTVCTLSGSTSLSQLNEGVLKNQILLTVEKSYNQCVERLLGGQVDAISTDQIVLDGLAAADPTRLSVVDGFTFGAEERYGIGLPHGDAAACEVMTAKIRDFLISGSWDQFFDKHFPGVDHASYKPDPYNLDSCV
ncbi:MAG: transporter substrate-binding domain-containing protein [Pseudonocardiaceae bacterium]